MAGVMSVVGAGKVGPISLSGLILLCRRLNSNAVSMGNFVALERGSSVYQWGKILAKCYQQFTNELVEVIRHPTLQENS